MIFCPVLQIWTHPTEEIMFPYGSSFVEKLRGVRSRLHVENLSKGMDLMKSSMTELKDLVI